MSNLSSEKVKAEILRNEKLIEMLKERLVRGEISEQIYAELKKEYEEKIASLKDDIAKTEAEVEKARIKAELERELETKKEKLPEKKAEDVVTYTIPQPSEDAIQYKVPTEENDEVHYKIPGADDVTEVKVIEEETIEEPQQKSPGNGYKNTEPIEYLKGKSDTKALGAFLIFVGILLFFAALYCVFYTETKIEPIGIGGLAWETTYHPYRYYGYALLFVSIILDYIGWYLRKR